ncbi:MAG: sulfur carrier protein ThiS [Terrimicrobiaceae bacterium]
MIRLFVNGEEQMLQSDSVAEMVNELGMPAPLLLVEHNGLALRKSDWEATVLREGDRIEILRISAGG